MIHINDIIMNLPVPIPEDAKCIDKTSGREFYYTEQQVRHTAIAYAKAILEAYVESLPVKPAIPFYRENEDCVGVMTIPITTDGHHHVLISKVDKDTF